MELELKFRCHDVQRLREQVIRAGAVSRGAAMLDNVLFDRPDGSLRAGDMGLRLRVATPLGDPAAPQAAILTFKGPRLDVGLGGPAAKQREEFETSVGDSAAARQIVESLGFRTALRYQVRRETWTCGQVTVCLDELPTLGFFVELEGPTLADLAALALQLQLAEADAEPLTYPQLAEAARRRTGEPPSLLF